jgi:hypothetical protein
MTNAKNKGFAKPEVEKSTKPFELISKINTKIIVHLFFEKPFNIKATVIKENVKDKKYKEL